MLKSGLLLLRSEADPLGDVADTAGVALPTAVGLVVPHVTVEGPDVVPLVEREELTW